MRLIISRFFIFCIFINLLFVIIPTFTYIQAGTGATGPNFFFKNLTVSPEEVETGQAVTISAYIMNTGGEFGSCNAILTINGVYEANKVISLEPLVEDQIVFTVSKDTPGTYTVGLGGYMSSFTVREASSQAASDPLLILKNAN